jgi:hypothetical protein
LAIHNCGDNEFIFSKGLVPGTKKIRSEQITRRWETHVKKQLGITVDYYPAHKHSNTTEMMDNGVSLNDAAALNSHTSTAMVLNIYDVKQGARQHERLKEISNKYV